MKYVNIVVFWVLAWSIGQSQVVLNGVEAFGFVNDYTDMDRDGAVVELGGFALELREILPDTLGFREDFKVFDGGYYQIQSAMDPSFGTPFDELVNQAASASPYYLVFARASDAEGLAKKIQVGLKLPTTGPFDSMDLAKQNMIRTLVEQEVNSCSYNLGFGWAYGETVGIEKLGDLLSEYLEGGLDFGPDQLTLNGFEKVGNTTASGSGVQDFSKTGVFDYAGYSQISTEAYNGIGLWSGSGVVIITDDADYPVDFNAAWNNFESQTAEAVLWLHLQGSGSNKSVYCKYKANMTRAEAEDYIQEKYNEFYGIVALKGPGGDTQAMSNGCSWDMNWRAKQCLPHTMPAMFDFEVGVGHGAIDATIEGILLFYHIVEYNDAVFALSMVWIGAMLELAYHKAAITMGFQNELSESSEQIWQTTKAVYDMLLNMNWDEIVNSLILELRREFKDVTFQNGSYEAGYSIMKALYDTVIGIALTATGVGAGVTATMCYKNIVKLFDSQFLVQKMGEAFRKMSKAVRCKFLIKGIGCFVEDTPVLMAGNANQFSLRNKGKALALAATMPIVAVPIQDVQLLDYAVAHKTVNSTYGFTASTDDDIYLGLLGNDPYTSDQQRERDEYQLDDENWNEVVFEEVLGGSTAKLALHNDWINQKGYQVDAVVEMNLPEQGISGPFQITSIKHIIPQKKPTDDDEADDYDYRPVTGLFIHEASDVWKIKFDNGEELGVTHNHPIYSTTIGDWQFAGMLSIGEEVLTKQGGAKVVSKEIDQAQQVYNLEVKDYHNFLVNASGVVVHNSGFCMFLKSFFSKFKTWRKAEPDWGLDNNKVDDLMDALKNNDPTVYSDPIITTTYNGQTYLVNGHHRLKAAKRLKNEQGIDIELQHNDINPNNIHEVEGGRFKNIQDFTSVQNKIKRAARKIPLT